MPSLLPKYSGTYALILELGKDQSIKIGRLGTYPFDKGYYAYVGSAFGPGGLNARIRHHLRISITPHWHVDYLRQKSSPVQIWWSTTRNRREHDWSSAMRLLSTSHEILKGFGASDCNCFSHLFHFKRNPSVKTFNKLLMDAGWETSTKTIVKPGTVV